MSIRNPPVSAGYYFGKRGKGEVMTRSDYWLKE